MPVNQTDTDSSMLPDSSGPDGINGPGSMAVRASAPLTDSGVTGPGGPMEAVHVFPIVDGYSITDGGVFEGSVQLTYAPCGVMALSRNVENDNWGICIRWMDLDGHAHQDVFHRSSLHDATALATLLSDRGLPIVPGKERQLAAYLSKTNPKARLRAVEHTGWLNDEHVFVLPHATIGALPDGERIIYQPLGYRPTAQSVRQAGSADGWRVEVALPCRGNPMLLFAIAASLSAPLLRLIGMESGGHHFYGMTSKGKTTLAQVAASVWGDGSDPAEGRNSAYVRKWNSTKNATEGLAEAHNDLTLIMDEIGEADGKEFGRTIYQLTGGKGKSRMKADGALKTEKTWRLILLSTGETSTGDFLEEEGGSLKGGQAVRLLNIPATKHATGEGIIMATPSGMHSEEFVTALKQACRTHYGWIGPAFIERLVNEDPVSLAETLRAEVTDTANSFRPQGASSELQRAVRRFALVAVTGELASSFGVLPFDEGEVTSAVKHVLDRYLDDRGGKGSDAERGITKVRDFILSDGPSKFQDLDGGDMKQNVAGYKDLSEGFYYFTPASFKHACGRHSYLDVARALKNRGLLRAPEHGRCEDRVTVPGTGKRVRVYAVSTSILEHDET